MKNSRVLAGLCAAVLSACGGGGGSVPPPTAGGPPSAPVPAPAPVPSPPPPPPAPSGLPGTWTAPLATCANPDVFNHPELGPQSLGNIPCLTGTYYATVIEEDFFPTGPDVGKACSLSITSDATFTVSIDGAVVATYLKTVSAIISGVEQSGTFVYGYWPNGANPVITATELYNSGSAEVIVNPTQFGAPIALPFTNPTSKLRIEANYKPPGSSSSTYLVCEG